MASACRTDDDCYGYPWNLHAYLTRGIIWAQRKIFAGLLKGVNDHRAIPSDLSDQEVNDRIRASIESGKAFLVARFGSVEFDAIMRGFDIDRPESRLVKFLKLFSGDCGPFWWDNSIRAGLLRTTGVFPADDTTLINFSRRALEDARQIDIIGSWNARELQAQKACFPDALGVRLGTIEPFQVQNPWSEALAGKKVLVINPFCDTIRAQYAKREQLFGNPKTLPEFELITYKSVTSFLGLETPFKNWFEALDKMCADIAQIDFDVAIIGCGAYGLSIGAFVKRELHRQAIHLGGATQLLFGIKGARWDNDPRYQWLYNAAWARPSESERPAKFKQVEGGTYW